MTFSSFEHHKSYVRNVFDRVANKYDIMNDIMSLGTHRLWKKNFVNRINVRPQATYIDVASGTGDIVTLLHKRLGSKNLIPNIMCVEPNPHMIKQGQASLINQGVLGGVTWVEASAESLPFDNNTFDALTISFGLRNVSDRGLALQEFYRVLKPGGHFLCMEFSHIEDKKILKKAYNLYSSIIPSIGQWVTGEKEAYEYLVQSIADFYKPDTLKNLLEKTGFHYMHYDVILSGIVAIHEGWKPR